MLIGLISDTHDLVRPEARAALDGVAQIVHAGDVCGPEVIAALREIAPVAVVRGNRDKGDWADTLPLELTLVLGGIRLHAVHILNHLTANPLSDALDLIVSGHSHKPGLREHRGVLYVNPGTAGPTRPGQPASLARLQIDGERIAVEFVVLGPGQP